MQAAPVPRRPGKEARERALAAVLCLLAAPLAAAVAVAIKVEGLLDRGARGPVLFREARIARGREIGLLKFRTLSARALDELPADGPTHIKHLEHAGDLTRVGHVLKQWYLDELPQLWNIVRGDMGLIGTRPYPIELYEEELAQGITRKRDMPAGLVGPVQASKGDGADGVTLDADYAHLLRTASGLRLLLADLVILWRSLRTQLRHEGL